MFISTLDHKFVQGQSPNATDCELGTNMYTFQNIPEKNYFYSNIVDIIDVVFIFYPNTTCSVKENESPETEL